MTLAVEIEEEQSLTAAPDKPRVAALSVIVPAYNEAASIADTIRSLQAQTLAPAEIIVVDDCSTDGTGDVARSLGVKVLRPLGNTGSKAGAQNFALVHAGNPWVMAIDADTALAPDAIEKLASAFDDDNVVAACGFVLPRHVRTVWERGRYIEYLFAFTFYKQVQDYHKRPLISSGCFSMYRTHALRECGGWSTRTLAEDMDLTWSFYEAGRRVRFVPESVQAILREQRGKPATPRRGGSHTWLHGLPLKMRFKRSKIYVSAVPVWLIGFIIGFIGAIMGIGGGFLLVPMLIYFLRVPTATVIGTSMLLTLVTMASATVMHAATNHLVDAVLALILMVGGVIGAQFGARAGHKMTGEWLRLLLGVLVLLVGLRFAYQLVVKPDDLYSIRILGIGA